MVTYGLSDIDITGVSVVTEGAVSLSVSRAAVSIRRTNIDGTDKVLYSRPDTVKCTLQMAAIKNINALFGGSFTVSGQTLTGQTLSLTNCMMTDFAVDYKTKGKNTEISVYKISFTAGGFSDGSSD